MPSDINEHLPTLLKYAKECDEIIEMGVRDVVSTWALLAARPKRLESWDILFHNNMNIALKEAYKENLDFKFVIADTTKASVQGADMLFIDTLHNYEQMKKELEIHPPKIRKYICFHDTVSYASRNEVGHGIGILPAIKEFLAEHQEWKIKESFNNNNGFLVIERQNQYNNT